MSNENKALCFATIPPSILCGFMFASMVIQTGGHPSTAILVALIVTPLAMFSGWCFGSGKADLIRAAGKKATTACVFIAIGLLGATSAEACNRCGRVGNACRYYVAPVVKQAYVAPQVTQHHHTPTYNNYQNHKHENHQHDHHYDNRETLNLVFNNSYPLPLLAQQGNTAYGYSLAAQAHSVDPQLILDRAGRLAENVHTLSEQATSGFLAIGSQQIAGQVEVAKIHAQGAAATAALQAAKGDPTGSLSFRAEFDSSGKLTVHPAEDGGRLSLSAGESLSCAKCHTGAKAKKGIVIDGSPITAADFDHYYDLIQSGEMPPESTLTAEQKRDEIRKLGMLIQ